VTLAFDAVTPSTKATNGADPWTFTHTPVGTPRGIIITAAHSAVSSDLISGSVVSYGGVNVPRIRSIGVPSGEAGRAYIWFLGTGVPTGAQTVSIDFSSSPLTGALFTCSSWTAADDIEAIDSDEVASASTLGLNATLQYGGRTCAAVFGAFEGRGVPNDATVLTGMSEMADLDFGPWQHIVGRQTTPGSSDFTAGYSQNVIVNSAALVAIAISEKLSVGGGPRSQGIIIAAQEVRRLWQGWARRESGVLVAGDVKAGLIRA
jgi:hypothetical protein